MILDASFDSEREGEIRPWQHPAELARTICGHRTWQVLLRSSEPSGEEVGQEPDDAAGVALVGVTVGVVVGDAHSG